MSDKQRTVQGLEKEETSSALNVLFLTVTGFPIEDRADLNKTGGPSSTDRSTAAAPYHRPFYLNACGEKVFDIYTPSHNPEEKVHFVIE